MTWSNLKTVDFFDLRKGWFTDRHPMEIPIGGATDSLNVVHQYGRLIRRPGLVEVHSTVGSSVAISMLANHVGFDDTKTLVQATQTGVGDVRLYEYDGSTWNAIGGPYLLANPVGNYRQTHVNFKGELFICTGPDGPIVSYDGSGSVTDVRAAQATAGKKCPESPVFVAAHPDRLITADMKNSAGDRIRYRVAWSAQLDPYVWRNDFSGDVGSGSAGFVDLADQTDPITGLYASGRNILVFRARSIYQGVFVGAPLTYQFERVSIGTGCAAPQTIQEYRDGSLVWMGDDNIYMGGVGRQPQAIGDPVVPYIRSLNPLTNLHLAFSLMDYDTDLYHLFLPDEFNRFTIMLSCNLRDGSWWKSSFAPAAPFSLSTALAFRDRSQGYAWRTRKYVAGSFGKIYELTFDATDDAGDDFNAYWESSVLSVDKFFRGVQKALVQEVRAYAEEGEVSLRLFYGDAFDRWTHRDFGPMTMDGSSTTVQSQRPPKSEHFRVRMTWNDPDTQVFGFSVGAIEGGSERGRR